MQLIRILLDIVLNMSTEIKVSPVAGVSPRVPAVTHIQDCVCVCVCVCVCCALPVSYTTQHRTVSDYCPSYPRDNHHRSDDVYWSRRGARFVETHGTGVNFWPANRRDRKVFGRCDPEIWFQVWHTKYWYYRNATTIDCRVLKTSEAICAMFGTPQRRFVVATKRTHFIRMFEYFRNWIFIS